MNHVGMDLGRRQSHLSWITEDGEVIYRKVLMNREALTKAFEGRSRTRVLLEASTMSEWVARFLEELGHEVIVADPNFAPMYADRSRRVKTDRRDAEALVQACIKGNYRTAHRLSDQARLLRARVLARATLVRARSKSVTLVRALLAPWGVSVESGSTDTFLQRLWKAEAPKTLLGELQPLLQQIEVLNEQLEEIDADLVRRVKGDPEIARLMTCPMIGPVTAATWVAMLDHPERFPSGEDLVGYLGLGTREWSSSEVQRKGRITKIGPTMLRSLLVEAGWRIMMSTQAECQALRVWALSVAERRGRQRAAVGVARRLARITYACWRSGAAFDSSRVGLSKTVRTGH